MSERHSPVEYDDREVVQISASGKSIGFRSIGSNVTGRHLTWVPISQLLPGSIRGVGETGTVILPMWLVEKMAEEGRI